ncbi:MAG: protein kinase domain-containing protein [Pyrinomonadaceae bacterium]
MRENDWQNVKKIFLKALETPAPERARFVAENSGGNAEIIKEVESLLAAHELDAGFIETPAVDLASILSNTTANGAGKTFGNYKIVREIGRGGMGAVFLAERSDGEFSQQVAIKIIRQAIAESEIISRFKRERQILASLNHPNIAKLLDGGVSGDGLPFLAMEFIEGEAITKFAARENLNLEERLKLFLKVCAAVAYAHRNLIVHRDIKPSNIFVAKDGEPKLLDFGLAKLLDENLSGDAAQTQTAFRALTPAYASPEQLKNEPITTASDIYSLGIVFYELLTGERPFHFEGKSLEEIIKTATQIEPPLPSAIHNSKLRIPQSAIRNPLLKGDLDNIALTALRKEPMRRYKSVEAFADDIERYLQGLPVAARPNTFKYRAEKFIKRHKVGVFAASLILLSLIGGIVVSIWQARQAQREKEKAESINAFLEQTLKYANPVLSSLRKNGKETTVDEVLDEAARRLDNGEFSSQPEVKAELERTIAATYLGQGKYQLARKHLEQYVILLKGLYGENHPKMIAGSIMWAELLFNKGETEEAEKTYRQFLPLMRIEHQKGSIKTEILADALNQFAYLRRTQGDSREAETLFRETLTLIPQLSGEAFNAVATTRSTLASVLADQGKFDEALRTAREAVEEYRGRGETDSPSYGFSLTVLGGFLAENDDFSEADAHLKEAETIFRRLISPSALWLGDNLRNQAISFYGQGNYAEAIAKADETLKIYEEGFGKHYDHYPTVLIFKGLSLAKSGQSTEGERLLREAVRLRRKSLPKEHFWVAIAESALGEDLTLQKRFGEAEPLLLKSYESLKASQGERNPSTLLARNRLVKLYEEWNKPEQAEQFRISANQK